MKESYTDYLFSKGCLTAEGEPSPAAVFALAKLFGIEVTEGAEYASLAHVRTAQRNLGVNVPEPFYRGFPDSVRSLTKEQLLFDQFMHYARTYGLGDFSSPGHSLFEGETRREALGDEAEIKKFRIISEETAMRMLLDAAGAMCESARPLSDGQYALLLSLIREEGFRPQSCACKDTAIRLLLDTGDFGYAGFLKLSDTIRLAETLQRRVYNKKETDRLNFRNRDRRLIVRVIDAAFRTGRADVSVCYEKRRRWKALLHHVHYRPAAAEAADFVSAVRGKNNPSVYARSEAAVAAGDPCKAARILLREKGEGALLRNLNYLLSRCAAAGEAEEIVSLIGGGSQTVLIQLLMRFCLPDDGKARTFAFIKFEKMRVHTETAEETFRRRSVISPGTALAAQNRVRAALREACAGKLGSVYAHPDMKMIALPLQESASFTGPGVLPKGSRVKLPEGKVLRAFTYWEGVNDIDLSAFGLTESGAQIEFSWRTMAGKQSDAILYSGDETSGFSGGAEYFDIDPVKLLRKYPRMRYLVFCDNVFSRAPFSACFCRAGYMTRLSPASGEVFEPKTVASAFRVTCESTFAYLFAFDLHTREFIWLNTARDGACAVAGETDISFLQRYFASTRVLSLYDYALLLAQKQAGSPAQADVVFSDEPLTLPAGKTQIRSCDIEQINRLLSMK